MSAKKIYPKEMFGTPEVNILNDNVLSSVDYNYNVVDSQYREVASFSFSDLVEDYEDAKSYENANNEVLYDGRKSNYDLKIERLYSDNIVKKITKDAGSSQSGQIWASPLFYILKMEYYVDRPLDMNKFRVLYSITDKVAKTRNPISYDSEDILTLRSQSYDSESSIQYFSNENDVISYYNSYELQSPLSGMPPCIIVGKHKIVLYFALHYYSLNNYFTTTYTSYSYITNSISIRLLNKCLEVSPISVDTNSQLMLQGNELIQEDVTVNFGQAVKTQQKNVKDSEIPNWQSSLYFDYDLTENINTSITTLIKPKKLVVTFTTTVGGTQSTDYFEMDEYIINSCTNNDKYYGTYSISAKFTNVDDSWVINFKGSTWSNGSLDAFSFVIEYDCITDDINRWIDAIPQKIANEYKNGKATIKLTAVYDDTNEYSVGDLVVPMKSDTEPVLKNIDGTDKQFEVTISEIVYSGRAIQNLELVEYVEVE